MSMVTAVKYLAEFAAEALKPWDPSREKAAVMLADLPLMVRLRADDDATADEVTYLVLGRFEAEPPAVRGKDFLDEQGQPWTETSYGRFHAAPRGPLVETPAVQAEASAVVKQIVAVYTCGCGHRDTDHFGLERICGAGIGDDTVCGCSGFRATSAAEAVQS